MAPRNHFSTPLQHTFAHSFVLNSPRSIDLPYRMVVGRSFAIYPGAWIWLENQCDSLTFVMREPAEEGIFTFGPRPVAEKSGQDLGVFRMFHPRLNPRDDVIPKADAAGMYYLISSTLM